MSILANSGTSDLFLNVAGPEFAHYHSSLLPLSSNCRKTGDLLKQALESSKKFGIRVHAWVICFSKTRLHSEYLNPGDPEVRQLMLSVIGEISSKYSVAGIHLDFIRYGEKFIKPVNAADIISRFVVEARNRVQSPQWLTAAVYGSYPDCIRSVAQDWLGWLEMGMVDYVVPMNYTASSEQFNQWLSVPTSKRMYAKKIIAGIGVTSNQSHLNADQVITQINLTRKHGCAGNALFDLDSTLEQRILPQLSKGIWKPMEIK